MEEAYENNNNSSNNEDDVRNNNNTNNNNSDELQVVGPEPPPLLADLDLNHLVSDLIIHDLIMPHYSNPHPHPHPHYNPPPPHQHHHHQQHENTLRMEHNNTYNDHYPYPYLNNNNMRIPMMGRHPHHRQYDNRYNRHNHHSLSFGTSSYIRLAKVKKKPQHLINESLLFQQQQHSSSSVRNTNNTDTILARQFFVEEDEVEQDDDDDSCWKIHNYPLIAALIQEQEYVEQCILQKGNGNHIQKVILTLETCNFILNSNNNDNNNNTKKKKYDSSSRSTILQQQQQPQPLLKMLSPSITSTTTTTNNNSPPKQTVSTSSSTSSSSSSDHNNGERQQEEDHSNNKKLLNNDNEQEEVPGLYDWSQEHFNFSDDDDHEDEDEDNDKYDRYHQSRKNYAWLGQVISQLPKLQHLDLHMGGIDRSCEMLVPFVKHFISTTRAQRSHSGSSGNSLSKLSIHPPPYHPTRGEATQTITEEIGIAIQAFHNIDDEEDTIQLESFTMTQVRSDSIATAVMTLPYLKRLKLYTGSSYGEISYQFRPTFRPILDALSLAMTSSSSPSCLLLEDITLSGFEWEEEFGSILNCVLSHPATQITSLSLTPRRITDIQWRQVIPCLRTNTKLQILKIHVENVTTMSSSSTSSSTSTSSLTTTPCLISGTWLSETTYQLAMNPISALQELHLSSHPTVVQPLDYIEAVKHLKQNTTLQVLNIHDQLDWGKAYEYEEKESLYQQLEQVAQNNYGIISYEDLFIDSDMPELETRRGGSNSSSSSSSSSSSEDDDDDDDEEDGIGLVEEEELDHEIEYNGETRVVVPGAYRAHRHQWLAEHNYNNNEGEDKDDEERLDLLRMIGNLNRAGRKYLIEDLSCKWRGVQVLSHDNVRDDLDAIFFHLLENPGLCCRYD